MVQYILTPWRDHNELLLVREQFYSSSTTGTNAAHHTQPAHLPERHDGVAQSLGVPASSGNVGTGAGRIETVNDHCSNGEGENARSRAASLQHRRHISDDTQNIAPATCGATEGVLDQQRDEACAGENAGQRLEPGQSSQVTSQLNVTATAATSTKQPDADTAQHQAVARVSMWMQRGNCPHLVESTALLMAAVLSDQSAVTDNAGSSTYAVRAAYSAAFSRFVTGLLDGHQDKQRKQSMYSIAKTIGLPATFVELRHQSTHEQLPSLAKLRTSAQKALTWIWDYYWKHLTTDEAGVSTAKSQSDPCREAVLGYLRGYEDEEVRRQKTMKELQRFDTARVLKVITDLQDTLPGNQVYLKCLKLSKEVMLQAQSKDVEPEAMDTTGTSEQVSGPKADAEESQSSETTAGWSLYEGAWKPKPIGMV